MFALDKYNGDCYNDIDLPSTELNSIFLDFYFPSPRSWVFGLNVCKTGN